MFGQIPEHHGIQSSWQRINNCYRSVPIWDNLLLISAASAKNLPLCNFLSFHTSCALHYRIHLVTVLHCKFSNVLCCPYMRNLQFNTNEHICETDRLTDIANRLAVAYTQVEEWRGGEKDSESGVSRCKLLYAGWISNKVLLCRTGNFIQYPGINRMEMNMKKNIYIYITDSFCYIAEINTTL